MNDKAKTILIGVVALIVGAALGVGYGMMQVNEVTERLSLTTQEKDQAVQNADRMRKMNDDAIKKYSRELGKLVSAAPAVDDPKLIDSARTILATRDVFRATLDRARASMDSDFDALAVELANPSPAADKVKQVLDNLKQVWPDKERGMEEATRKLLTDLGLLQGPSAPASGAAPAAAPAATK